MCKFGMILTLFFLSLSLSHAHIGAASLGAGSPGYAAVDPTSSAVINPASLTHVTGLWINLGSSSYQSRTSDIDLSETYLSLSENGPDSTVASGLVFSQSKTATDGDLRDIYLGMANFGLGNTAIGLSVHHQILEDDTLGRHYQTNLNLGIMYIFSPTLGAGFVAQNILDQESSVPKSYRLRPHWGTGLMLVVKEFLRARADISDSEAGLGFENLFTKWSVFRMGFAKGTNSSPEALSLGFGFIGPKFHINYGFRSYRYGSQDQLHCIDLNLPF